MLDVVSSSGDSSETGGVSAPCIRSTSIVALGLKRCKIMGFRVAVGGRGGSIRPRRLATMLQYRRSDLLIDSRLK